jgi:hydroxymethylglutaryl-CoA lyase
VSAGVQRIQVSSFVHPTLVPAMGDAEDIIKNLPNNESVVFSALVLNTKGVERAKLTGIKHLAISLSASDTHSRKNANKSLDEAKTEMKGMVAIILQ